MPLGPAERGVGRPLFDMEDPAAAIHHDHGRIELDLERLLELAVPVHARDEHGIWDTELTDGLGRRGPAFLRRRSLLTGDPDHLDSLPAQPSLQVAFVGDRLPTLKAPAPPEVEEDHVGVEVAERDHLAREVGELEVDDAALRGIDLAGALPGLRPLGRRLWHRRPAMLAGVGFSLGIGVRTVADDPHDIACTGLVHDRGSAHRFVERHARGLIDSSRQVGRR